MPKLNKIKKSLRALLIILGENVSLTLSGLIALSLILGGMIFYKYSFLAMKKTAEPSDRPLYFDEAAFQEVIGIWEIRQKTFEEADTKQFPDPFRVQSVPAEELTE